MLSAEVWNWTGGWRSWFRVAARTELQRLVLDQDWAATPLGPESCWSPTLRTAVSTCLNSRFPMLLMWGPELVMVYNDAYAPMLGNRHPDALGREPRTSGGTSGPTSDPWSRRSWPAGHLLRGPAAGDDAARVRGGDLLHLLLQSGRGAGRPVVGPARHRRRDDAAGARHPAAERAAATGQPAAVGPREHRRAPSARPSACSPAPARTAPSALVYLLDEDGEPAAGRRPRHRGRGQPGRQRDPRAGARGDRHRRRARPSRASPSSCPGCPAPAPARPGRTTSTPPSSFRSPSPAGTGRSARWCSARARTCGWTTSTGCSSRWPPGRSRPRSRTRRRSRRAPPRGGARRARPRPGPVLHRRGGHAAARRPGPDRAARRLRRPLRAGHAAPSRSVVTGTTSSTCPRAGTASSSATWSGVGSPPPR